MDDLFVSATVDMMVELPRITKADYTANDYEELEYYRLKHEDKDGMIAVQHQGEWLTFV